MEEREQRFARLVGRVLDGAVVPFVGAGFSYGAQHPSGWVSHPNRMVVQLGEYLAKTLADYQREPPKGCDEVKAPAPPGAGVAAQTLQNLACGNPFGLAHQAELASLIGGFTRVCEKLQIDQYAQLRPLPSHRYLAYLVREGLIREVITTNYDCCIETAFRESFGSGDAGNQFLGVVRSLEQYRRKAGKHSKDGHLLLYKINGCAAEYAKAWHAAQESPGEKNESLADAAERIILTERQLQNFRHEYWARDLFRDRARSRNFLFSGFGSEEPQIRHTALALMEEFGNGAKQEPREISDLPNAPFIQVHGTTLSFYQLQILVAFWDAHCGAHIDEAHPERRIEPMLENVFTGVDACHLDPCATGEKKPQLDASLFFREIYERAFLRLVMQGLEEGVFVSWLRQYTDQYRSWLGRLKQFLVLDAKKKCGYPWRALLKPAEDGCPFPLTFWRMLWVMRYRSQKPPTGWYLPLREEPLQILVTLLLISFSGNRSHGARRQGDCAVRAEPPHGLAFTVRDPRNGTACNENAAATGTATCEIKLHLVCEQALSEARSREYARQNDRLLRIVSVPSFRGPRPEGRWTSLGEPMGPKGHPRLICGLQVIVPAGDLIREAAVPESARFWNAVNRCFSQSRSKPLARTTLKSRSSGDQRP